MSTWLTLIGMIVTGIGANLALIYGMSSSLQDRMDALDDRWQARTLMISRELKVDIRRVEDKIPPEWFRGMVERNTNRIDSLEKQARKSQP